MHLPSKDSHFIPSIVTGKYQHPVFKAALPYLKNYSLAIDVGAHIGLWSRSMSVAFDRVVAYEPDPENFLCLCRNAPINVITYNWALGKAYGHCGTERKTETNSGDCVVTEKGNIRIAPLDAFGWCDVGLLKVDTQGMELDVLRGSEQLLKREKPLVIVETTLSEVKNSDCAAYLVSLGAMTVKTVGKDTIFAWPATD